MMAVKGSSPDYTTYWSEKLVLEFLRKFLHKEHWEQINKSVFNFENDDQFSQRADALRIVKKAIDHCNKALDCYGTAQCLLKDLEVYFASWMYSEIDYKDAQLVQYVPKSRILQYIVNDRGTMGRMKIIDLYVLTISEMLEKRVGRKYELISRSWLEVAKRDFKNAHDEDIRIGIALVNNVQAKAFLWTKNPPTFRSVIELLAQYFGDQADQQLFSRLEIILRQHAKVSLDEKIPVDFNSYYHLCNYERCLIEISSFLSRVINGNPYTFLSFAESKLKLGAEFPVEPPVIRLICHNDEKFLFVNDVKTAMAKVSSDRKKQQFPRGFLELDTEKNTKNGIYHIISHSKYLEIMEKWEFDVSSITLVSETIVKTRHRTVPIVSPYNTKCIPVVEVFDELLSILTIGMQFWRKIHPKNMEKVQKKFEEVCQMFMDVEDVRETEECWWFREFAFLKHPGSVIKKRYFVEIERVEQLGEILRKSVAPLLEKEVIVEAPKLYAYDLEYLSLLSLRVGLDQLNLPDLYDEIYPLAMIVSSFRSVYFEKQPVGLIELLMAVQDCLAICMIKRMPEVQEFFCKQEYCSRYWFAACNCEATKAIQVHPPEAPLPQIAMIHQEDVDMKFDYFENEKKCFNTLIVKDKDRRFKLVNSEMVYLYVGRLLEKQIKQQHRDSVLAAYKTKCFGLTARKSFPFLMTAEEMITVANNILEKFKSRESAMSTSIQMMNTRRKLDSQSLVDLMVDSYDDCLKYLSELLQSSVEFEKCYPDRTAYIPYSEEPMAGKTKKIVQSGEFLGLVKERMQRNPSAKFKSYWDYLSRTIYDFQYPDKWAPADLTDITQFGTTPIGMDKFCFVPNLQYTMKDIPKKVSDMIVAMKSEKAEIPAGDGGTEQDPLENFRKELSRANEKLKEKDAVISRYSEKFDAQASTIEDLQRKVDTLSGTNLETMALLQAMTAECEELKLEKANNKIQQKENERILQQHTLTKMQLEKENQKLKESVKAEKKKLKIKEEQWKKETASSTASKNAEIQKLKQQLLERENQVKNLEKNHETLTRSLRLDLSNCQEEKEALTTQLAEASAKIQDLEASRVTRPDVDAQLAAMTHKGSR